AFGKGAHGPEHAFDRWHDIVPVEEDFVAGAAAQSGVQYRPALRHVDALAGKHCLPALLHACCLRHAGEQLHGLSRHGALGIVQYEVADRQRMARETLRIVCEGGLQIEGIMLLAMPRSEERRVGKVCGSMLSAWYVQI